MAARHSLADKRETLCRYRSSLGSLRPIEERRVDNLPIPDDNPISRAVGGVYAIAAESVRLFIPGSASRGIPHKEWKIPLPDIGWECYGFYPDADVIAFITIQETMTCVYRVCISVIKIIPTNLFRRIVIYRPLFI